MESQSDIIISLINKVRIVKFNRPHKKNAINLEMYKTIIDILRSDADNDEVVLTIITGVGDYYSSGVDLKVKSFSFDSKKIDDNSLYFQYVKAFIIYPKLIIAVVNGPVVGIAATTLALCDVVYASDRATFSTPFLKLGLVPEGCSTYLFPRIMGKSKATEMLILGKILTAEEALKANLISEIIPHKKLEEKIEDLLRYSALNLSSLKNSKSLIKEQLKHNLLKISSLERIALKEAYRSGVAAKSIRHLLKNASKL